MMFGDSFFIDLATDSNRFNRNIALLKLFGLGDVVTINFQETRNINGKFIFGVFLVAGNKS